MARGSEAYLQTWERAAGVRNDGCRDAARSGPRRPSARSARATTSDTVLRRIGQPHTRLGTSFGYCAKDGAGRTVRLTVQFDAGGRLRRVV